MSEELVKRDELVKKFRAYMGAGDPHVGAVAVMRSDLADATFSAHAVMSLLSRIDTQAARIAELEGLVDLYGAAITDVADGAEDEGDRAYFGSTNDLDRLKELREQHFQRRFVSGTALEGKKR